MLLARRTVLVAAVGTVFTAAGQTLNDARVKARLAVTLARYTQWPASAFAAPGDPFTLCLLHRSETLMTAFAEQVGQSVAGHPLRVLDTNYLPGTTCHALFIHDSAERDANWALSAVSAAPVLTIGDTSGFSLQGGMVELANVNDAIRLDVNLKALRASRLDLSSQVLKLARQVRE